MTEAEFRKFAKIPRLFRDIEITEKIDGTNGQVHILEDGRVLAAGRNRYLTIESDNYGFAAWVEENKETLLQLGTGRHYGEWFGAKINRAYGMQTRRFLLFDRDRYIETMGPEWVVPRLYLGTFSEQAIRDTMDQLSLHGSRAVIGFHNPEGIVVRHIASGHVYKYTFGSDGHKRGE